MTIDSKLRTILNDMSKDATVDGDPWETKNPPEVVISDCLGFVRGITGALNTRTHKAPEGSPRKYRSGAFKADKYSTDDENSVIPVEESGTDSEFDVGQVVKGPESKNAFAKRPFGKSGSTAKGDPVPASPRTVAAATAEVTQNFEPVEPRPLGVQWFYTSKEFVDAHNSKVPMLPLYNRVMDPVRGWVMKGVKKIVLIFDKGSPPVKDDTCKVREKRSVAQGEERYDKSLRFTSTCDLVDTSKLDATGAFTRVRVDYQRVMNTRRLKNIVFEWFVQLASREKFPEGVELYFDYVDQTSTPRVVQVTRDRVTPRGDLTNSHGEGDVAVVSWLTYFARYSTLLSCIDGDTWPIASFHAKQRLWDAEKKRWTASLLWTDVRRVMDVCKAVDCLQAKGLHPMGLALACILCTNDYIRPEHKKDILPGIGPVSVVEGLQNMGCCDAIGGRTLTKGFDDDGNPCEWYTCKHRKEHTSSYKALDDIVDSMHAQFYTVSGLREHMRTCKTDWFRPIRVFMECVQTAIKNAKDATGRKGKACDPPSYTMCKRILGNIEYWRHGRSLIEPGFRAVVGGYEHTLTKAAERDKMAAAEFADMDVRPADPAPPPPDNTDADVIDLS